MKILVLDIETRPNLAYVWKIWDENISLSQLVEVGEVICFGAKWLGESEAIFRSTFHDSKKTMLQKAWDLMDEADAIIHFNGKSFDVKHLNREFLLAGMTPPSPHKNIDLLTVTRGQFKFVSNKLDHVASQLGVGSKVSHEGFGLWLACMNNDADAWERMKEYCIHDVYLTEEVYDKLLPWIKSHPSIPTYRGDDKTIHEPACRNCGSYNIQFRGYATTAQSKFHRFVCKDCGTWGRLTSKVSGVGVTSVAS